ncbi:hypothetical protein JCM10207_004425 [Rhodosporidiobolus poonsookiae]
MSVSSLTSGISSTTALSLSSSVRFSSSLPSTFLAGLDQLTHNTPLALRRGDLIELQGLPGSGKTSLLLHLAATALLPRTAHIHFADLRGGPGLAPVPIGGSEHNVAWIECSARGFPTARLAALLRSLLVEAVRRFRAPLGLSAPKEDEFQSVLDEALARLHVFQPSSTAQLAATVRHLPRWAAQRALDLGTDEPELGAVLIDGMSEFAWADQLAREQSTLSSSSSSSETPPLRLLLSALAHLRATLAPLIWITQHVFRPSVTLPQTSEAGLPFYAHHYAPPHWPSLAQPNYDAATVGRGGRGPLEPPLVGGSAGGAAGGGKREDPWPTVPVKLHITLHPPDKASFARGSSWAQVMAERSSSGGGGGGGRGGGAAGRGERERRGEGMTEGVRCVVRGPGGREVGSWEVAVGEGEVRT